MAEVERTVEEENEIKRQQMLTLMRQFRDACLAVFGPHGKHTVYGATILQRLDDFCERSKAIPEWPQDKQGATDAPRVFRNMGRREVADLIHNALDWKEPVNADSSRSP